MLNLEKKIFTYTVRTAYRKTRGYNKFLSHSFIRLQNVVLNEKKYFFLHLKLKLDIFSKYLKS